jgi:quercetin dioxygenase-like cupin family protein
MQRPEFEAMIAQQGYAPPVLVQREAGYALSEHAHEFDAQALITQGEFEIVVAAVAQRYCTGDVFQLPRGTVHTERCVDGAVSYLSARRT